MQWTKEEIEQIVITPEMYRRLRLKLKAQKDKV